MVKFGRKFFFDTKHSKKRRLVTFIIIGVVVLLLIIMLALIIRGINNKKPKPKPNKTKVVVRTQLNTEIYGILPEKTAYFEKLENFDVNKITLTYPDYLPLEETYSECSDKELIILEEIKNGKDANSYEGDPYSCVRYVPTGLGSYDVTVNYGDKDYTVELIVEDTKPPVLVAKDYEIVEGETYSINNFVESCADNSKKDCTYSYYSKAYTTDNDFDKLTEVGVYEIALVALDSSGNTSVPVNATLTIKNKPPVQVYSVAFNTDGAEAISNQYVNENEKATAPANPTKDGYTFAGWYKNGNKFDFNTPITSDIVLTAKWNKNATPKPKTDSQPQQPKPSTCSNGDLKYNASKYPTVAVFVTDGNCAISKSNLNLTTHGNKATTMVNAEKAKLKKWQDANGYDYYYVVIGDNPQGVPNTSGKGYVGYTIQFSIAKKVNGDYSEIARYYLDKDGKRVFSLNLINMPES